MWFIFPQIAGLGRSPTAQFYAIRSLHEARAFLAASAARRPLSAGGRGDPRLGRDANTPPTILGDVDAMKLKSSLTLFEIASGDPLFADALRAFFGEPDQATLKLLKRA